MKIGVGTGGAAWATDPGALGEYVQNAERLGYHHFQVASHVAGVDYDHHPDAPRGPYDHRTPWHDPLTLYAYLAASTARIEFVTGMLLLPLQPAVLVAKQAAEVDILSGGRLRLGVSISWNALEYEALGADFRTRGRRIEEQIAVMRELWTQDTVAFEGRFHRLRHVGINPPPVQRPIPVWLGVGVPGDRAAPPDRLLERIGRIADGWVTLLQPGEALRLALARIQEHAAAAGRPPDAVGVEGVLNLSGRGPEEWRAGMAAWRDAGATHLLVRTGSGPDATVEEHIDHLRRFKEACL